MAQEQEGKRGPGRPKVTVSRNEVWHTPESLKDLEWWQATSKETGNHGAAIRRLLAVVRIIEIRAPFALSKAIKETKP